MYGAAAFRVPSKSHTKPSPLPKLGPPQDRSPSLNTLPSPITASTDSLRVWCGMARLVSQCGQSQESSRERSHTPDPAQLFLFAHFASCSLTNFTTTHIHLILLPHRLLNAHSSVLTLVQLLPRSRPSPAFHYASDAGTDGVEEGNGAVQLSTNFCPVCYSSTATSALAITLELCWTSSLPSSCAWT